MEKIENPMSRLLFRRQFLITPELCESFGDWQHLHVGNHHIYAHTDLQLSFVESTSTNITITLLGYIIDPNSPEKSNTDLLNKIVSFSDSVECLGDYLNSVSGRFVLIVNTPSETLLFHDACGLRSVYYAKYKKGVLVGSQPLIINQILQLEKSERISSYLLSYYTRDNLEHWLPSGCSLYEGVYHLVPNHYLRFSTVEQIRYWPQKALISRSASEVAHKASDILEKLMIAGNNRFKLALPLTAGWDSRVLLSASKRISKEIYFYTLQYRDLGSNSNDIKIPEELLRSLGLTHKLIDCRKMAPDEFRIIYEQNSLPSHMNDWGEIASSMVDKYPQDTVCVKGNCSEIARCYYYKYGSQRKITSYEQILALEDGWDTLPFVRNQISVWYDQAAMVASKAKIDILDLFYWEHRMGSWQAQSQLEWDIVQEAYTPFNHRELLELMLGVPASLRCAPNYSLYKMMIELMWPEAMKQPMNPPTFRQLVANLLVDIGLYEGVKSFYKQIRNYA